MAVIKSAQSSRLLRESAVFDMSDLRRQAERLVAEAREEAERLRREAQADARALTGSADERGYQQGLQRGLEEGRAAGLHQGREEITRELATRFDEVVRGWSEAMGRFEADRARFYAESREDVIRLALRLTRKIVHRVVAADSLVVRDQIAEALKILARPTSIEIAVNPDDRALVDEGLPQFTGALSGCEHVTVREDAALHRGGCIIATSGGRIDASLETLLDRAAEALLTTPQPNEQQSPPNGQ